LRAGRRKAILLGWALGTLGTVLVTLGAAIHSWLPVATGVFAAGAGSAAMLQARFALPEALPPERRVGAIIRLQWVGALGSVAGPLLLVVSPGVDRLLRIGDFATSYVIASALMLLGTLVVAARSELRTSDRLKNAVKTPSSKEPKSIEDSESTPVIAGSVILFVQLAMVVAMTEVPLSLAHQGVSPQITSLLVSLHLLGMYAPAPLAMVLRHRVGSQRSLRWSTAVLGLLITCLSPAGGVFGSAIFLFAIGVAWSFAQTLSTFILGAFADGGGERAVRFQGFVDGAVSLASGVGIVIAGCVSASVAPWIIRLGCGVLILVALPVGRAVSRTKLVPVGDRAI
jgi:MFS family permease